MANHALNLPNELWYRIVQLLDFPELQHLSNSCSKLHVLCKQRLRTMLDELRVQYRSFDVDAARHQDPASLHALLLKILRHEIPATYVIEVDCGETCETESENCFSSQLQIQGKNRALLKTAIKDSPWIYNDEADDYLKEICAGNEDALLCVLLPLLPNLRWLCPPIDVEHLPQIVARIATAKRAAQKDQKPNDGHGSFDKLVQVSTRAYNGDDFGMELEKLAPFTSLPAVLKVVAHCVRDDVFGAWPQCPKSRVPEMFFTKSSVTASAIRGFAQGFEGPCVMRQDWSYAGETCTGDAVLEWDHYEISGTIDPTDGSIVEGTRWEKMEIKYDPEDHWRKPGWENGRYRRGSTYSDGMNAMFDGSLADWRSLIKIRE